MLKVVAAMMGGEGQSWSILLDLNRILEFGEEKVIDGISESFCRGGGIVVGGGFRVDGDFGGPHLLGGQWVQLILEVGPQNNYNKFKQKAHRQTLSTLCFAIFFVHGSSLHS